jgi:hypothetical protein
LCFIQFYGSQQYLHEPFLENLEHTNYTWICVFLPAFLNILSPAITPFSSSTQLQLDLAQIS